MGQLLEFEGKMRMERCVHDKKKYVYNLKKRNLTRN